jgi:hypothetical protein
MITLPSLQTTLKATLADLQQQEITKSSIVKVMY